VHAGQAVRQLPEGREQRFGGAVGVVAHQDPRRLRFPARKIVADEV